MSADEQHARRLREEIEHDPVAIAAAYFVAAAEVERLAAEAARITGLAGQAGLAGSSLDVTYARWVAKRNHYAELIASATAVGDSFGRRSA